MNIKENVSLKQFNTFNIDVRANYFYSFTGIEDLRFVFSNKKFHSLNILVLGGGSNMLLVNDYEGLVLKNEMKGIIVTKIEGNYTYVKVQGGENWHQFVRWCLSHNLGGVENLSLIPGTVGAAPIQNIGAYGVELKDVFHELTAFNVKTHQIETFTLDQCKFGYRDSIFKTTVKGQYIILSVTFKLTNNKHQINDSYGAIKDVLKAKNISTPTIQNISEAVIEIRSSKLPNPDEIGNSGSFFKNPEIEINEFLKIKESFPDIVSYHLPNGKIKIPAGWLIEQCGWKGKRIGNTGSYIKQALVLVNYGDATGKEVWDLALAIKKSVKEKFGIDINPEVNIIK